MEKGGNTCFSEQNVPFIRGINPMMNPGPQTHVPNQGAGDGGPASESNRFQSLSSEDDDDVKNLQYIENTEPAKLVCVCCKSPSGVNNMVRAAQV